MNLHSIVTHTRLDSFEAGKELRRSRVERENLHNSGPSLVGLFGGCEVNDTQWSRLPWTRFLISSLRRVRFPRWKLFFYFGKIKFFYLVKRPDSSIRRFQTLRLACTLDSPWISTNQTIAVICQLFLFFSFFFLFLAESSRRAKLAPPSPSSFIFELPTGLEQLWQLLLRPLYGLSDTFCLCRLRKDCQKVSET